MSVNLTLCYRKMIFGSQRCRPVLSFIHNHTTNTHRGNFQQQFHRIYNGPLGIPQQHKVRLFSMDLKKKNVPKRHDAIHPQPQQRHKALNDASKIESSNQLYEALQQNLVQSSTTSSTTTNAATSTTPQRPSMTTTQLAMTKYGNPSSNATTNPTTSGGSSPVSPSMHYISVQERQRKNQQAIINIIFSFGLVLLASQTFNSGIEKRRIQQQYHATQETLQQTQAVLQQHFFPSSGESNEPSPEILQIAKMIVQEELRNHDSQRTEKDGFKNRGWFHNPITSVMTRIKSASRVEDDVAILLETTTNGQPQTHVAMDEKEQQQLQRIALLIQEQIQLLLRDVAFDEYQKESLRVQALAASSSLSSAVPTSTTGTSFHHVAKINTEPNHWTEDDVSTLSMEQLLLESLQNENNLTNSTTINSTNVTTTNDQDHPMVDPVNETVAAMPSTSDNAPVQNKVVKKRLFSI